MDWQKYCKAENWHDDAKLFPLINGEEMEALVQDIRDNGLQSPITLYEDKVLDGRNRVRACKEAGIKPKFDQWHLNGVSPLQFVIAQNLKRRHLTIDQRAALAAELVPIFAKEARKRQIEAGKNGASGGRGNKKEKPLVKKCAKALVEEKSAAKAARIVGGVSTRYVEAVVSLDKKKPGTLNKIQSGKLKIREAKSEVDEQFKPRTLSEQFVVPPFTVLDARQGYWTQRKQFWRAQGVNGGHNEQLNGSQPSTEMDSFADSSVFDPVLAECVCRWFAPKGGRVLDPFAGEPTKGLVAAKCGLEYTGVDLRRSQVAENQRRAKAIGVSATWLCGDSAELSSYLSNKATFDLVFTSPPYYDLEKYSKRKKDGSAFATYDKFLTWYKEIFSQAVARLKPNRFLVVKVGDVRDEKGFYRNFVADNISCFLSLGLRYYNEAILVTSFGTAAMRVRGQFPNYRKFVKTHQNLLCFFNGDDPKRIPQELGQLDGGDLQ